MLTVRSVEEGLSLKSSEIREKLKEFETVGKKGSEKKIFEELAFCIFTAGASAKMGLKAIEAVRDLLAEADEKRISDRLRGVYRFPNTRARYLVHTRNHLARERGAGLMKILLSFKDPVERRDFIALDKDVKGIGFKEASHFLRNVGFRGYAILDKHVLRCLFELGVADSARPTRSRAEYLETESAMKKFSRENGFDLDELDLFFWSEKTGKILK